MAKHLTDAEIETLADCLLGWRGELTWGALTEAAEKLIWRKPARQTLARSARIRIAFATAKKRLAEELLDGSPKLPRTLEIAGKRIARLEAQVGELKVANAELLEQFVTWQYNAYALGITEHQLNKQRPAIDLGASN